MLIGPTELEIIAAVNTANVDLRRALLGQSTLLTELSLVVSSSWVPSNISLKVASGQAQHQHTP